MSAPRARRLTGRQVLIWVLAFFGVVTLVNAVMIWFALTSHYEVLKRTATDRSAPTLARGSTSWPT
jgi:nitrogen fixation protein FixH